MNNIRILLYIVMLSLLGYNVFAAQAYWVNDKTACPSSNATEFPGQGCSPTNICGSSGSTLRCYDTSTLSAPASTATSNTDQDSNSFGLNGGYIINCFAAEDASAPLCDNTAAYWCDRNSTCYTTYQRDTTCTASVFGKATCGACRTGYANCTDTNKCNITIGTTNYISGANNNYNSSCGCQCDTNYKDCDSSQCDAGNGCEYHYNVACGTHATNISTCNTCQCDSGYYYCDGAPNDADGCEITNGGACTVGILAGTYSCTVGSGGCYVVSGGTQYSCDCVVSKSYFQTGTLSQYYTQTSEAALLWGVDYSPTKPLMNLTNKNFNSTFIINGTGCIIFNDTTSQCTASVAGSPSGTEYDKNTSSDYLYNNSLTIFFNGTIMNITFSQLGNLSYLKIGENKTYNASYESTYNVTYESTYNVSYESTYNATYEKTYNISYDSFMTNNVFINSSDLNKSYFLISAIIYYPNFTQFSTALAEYINKTILGDTLSTYLNSSAANLTYLNSSTANSTYLKIGENKTYNSSYDSFMTNNNFVNSSALNLSYFLISAITSYPNFTQFGNALVQYPNSTIANATYLKNNSNANMLNINASNITVSGNSNISHWVIDMYNASCVRMRHENRTSGGFVAC